MRLYGGPNGYGYTRHSGKYRCGHFDDLKLQTTPTGAADLRHFVDGDVLDQGQTSSCTGHGVAMAATVAMRSHGSMLDMISPLGCYGVGRSMDRLVTARGTLPPLTDDGCEVAQVVTGIQIYGTRPMGDKVIVDGATLNSDCGPANVNVEPNLADLVSSYATRLLGAHMIMSRGMQRIVDISLALDAGYPIVFGTFVDSAFEQYSGGVFGAAKLSDPAGGGHCMTLLGYHGLGSKFVGIGRDSWSKSWGQSGDFNCSPAFVAQFQDIYAMAVRQV